MSLLVHWDRWSFWIVVITAHASERKSTFAQTWSVRIAQYLLTRMHMLMLTLKQWIELISRLRLRLRLSSFPSCVQLIKLTRRKKQKKQVSNVKKTLHSQWPAIVAPVDLMVKSHGAVEDFVFSWWKVILSYPVIEFEIKIHNSSSTT